MLPDLPAGNAGLACWCTAVVGSAEELLQQSREHTSASMHSVSQQKGRLASATLASDNDVCIEASKQPLQSCLCTNSVSFVMQTEEAHRLQLAPGSSCLAALGNLPRRPGNASGQKLSFATLHGYFWGP